MCTTSKEKPELQIAEHDIVTYKYVIKCKTVRYGLFGLRRKTFYKSGVKKFVYRQNKIYETELGKYEIWTHIFTPYYESNKGFYSWESKKDANVKCIIPKGAKYYRAYDIYDKRWIYTSDKIKIIEDL